MNKDIENDIREQENSIEPVTDIKSDIVLEEKLNILEQNEEDDKINKREMRVENNDNNEAKYNENQDENYQFSNKEKNDSLKQLNMAIVNNKKSENNNKVINIFKIVLIIAIIIIGAALLLTDFGSQKNNIKKVEMNIADEFITEEEEKGLIPAIVESCMPSVVSIKTLSDQQYVNWFGVSQQEIVSGGSGIIVAENDDELLIVTNYHVVEDSKKISVFFSNKDGGSETEHYVDGVIKGYDSQRDLAVVSIHKKDINENIKDLICIAKLGNSENIKLGESVIAIGNALGYGQSVTFGIISAKDREMILADNFTNKLIQTDAAINPGNSGGALLNMNGEVIGINSAKFASEEVEGMGYAIPISDVYDIIDELINKQTRSKVEENERGYLGITGIDVDVEVSKTYNMPLGVFIKTVESNSAANAAGIVAGDIIVKLGGNRITNFEELNNELQYYAVNDKVEVVVNRIEENKYVEKTFTVKLAKKSN